MTVSYHSSAIMLTFLIFILYQSTVPSEPQDMINLVRNQNQSPIVRNRIIPEWNQADLKKYIRFEKNSTYRQTSYIRLPSNPPDDLLCWYEAEGYWTCGTKHGIEGVSVILNGNYSALPDLALYRITNKTIISMLNSGGFILDSLILLIAYNTIRYTPYNCDCASVNSQLSEYLVSDLNIVGHNKTVQSFVKLGIEYNQNVLQCCIDAEFSILKFLELVVLRIDISPMDTVLSYGSISERMESFIETNRKFVRKFNANCTIFVRVKYNDNDHFNRRVNPRFQDILFHYVNSWLAKNPVDEIVIISQIKETNLVTKTNQFLRKRVAPLYKDSLTHATVGHIDKRNCIFRCDVQHAMDKVSSVFDNIVHLASIHASICAFRSNCSQNSEHMMSNFNYNKIKSSSLIINVFKEDYVEHATNIQLIFNATDVLKLSTVYFWNGYSSWNTFQWSEMVNELGSKGIRIGCYITLGIITKNIRKGVSLASLISKLCGLALDVLDELVFYIYVGTHTQKLLPRFLDGLNQIINVLTETNPGKQFIPFIILEEIPGEYDTIIEDDVSLKRPYVGVKGLYCDKHIKRVNENYNGVLSFAYANNWAKLLLGSLFGEDCLTGWWRRVQTGRHINQSDADFPIFIRSTSELEGELWKLPGTFPCILWNEKAQEMGNVFNKDGFSGAVLNMDLKSDHSLKVEELETLILVTFEKFSYLENVTLNKNDLLMATNALLRLGPEYLDKMKGYMFSQFNLPMVYIRVPFSTLLMYKIINGILELQNYAIAVHYSGWEEHWTENENFSNGLKTNFSHTSQTTMFGLSVHNCNDEINLKLSRLKGVPFIDSIEYLICNVEPFLPNMLNMASMQKYFDTLFYINTYIEKFLFVGKSRSKNFEVMFRVNLVSEREKYPANKLDTKEFLKFIESVNQHGLAYKIKYFVVTAFGRESSSGESGSNCWRLDDYTDLTNLSVYVDREQEYFGHPATPSIQLLPRITNKDAPEKSFNMLIAVIMPVVFFILLIAIFTLSFYFRRFRIRYMTEKEIIGFYNGEEISSNILESECSRWLKSRFPKHFEISKKSIQIGNLIGKGAFGVVYRGVLSGEVPVAVKKPDLTRRKESFRSCLAEVKILCCIGNHQNVVSFLGAYTKEIKRGRIYIVMEYCEKGSLQHFLRDIQSKNTGENVAVDLYQLYRFSEHIASGMAYIGEKGVIHGDLSTRNVLLTSELICKISDFGLSRRLYEMNEYVKKGREPLPWKWMAPESLKNKIFTTKSDVWSYGITLCEIYSLGAVPYPGLVWSTDFVTKLEDGLRMEKPKYSTDEIYGKLVACWNLIGEERPSFEQLEEYFATLKNKEYEVV